MNGFKKYIAYCFECQFCGCQGEVNIDKAASLEGAIEAMKSEGWDLVKYKDEPESLRRLACPRDSKEVPNLDTRGDDYEELT